MEYPLSQLGPGKEGVVKYLVGGFEFQRKIFSLGIRTGKKIKVVSSQPFRGPVVIRIGNMKVAIGRGMASKIIIDVR